MLLHICLAHMPHTCKAAFLCCSATTSPDFCGGKLRVSLHPSVGHSAAAAPGKSTFAKASGELEMTGGGFSDDEGAV